MTIEVLKPGALTTVQDLGRYGHQRFGVVAGGAMDDWSHRIANALVGNDDDAATLEITLLGPSLRFSADTRIALLGADLSAHAGTQALPLGRALTMKAGAQLDFGARVCGMRTYLAVAGGVQVEPVLGSRSTYLRGGFGGYAGRALRKGDVLQTAHEGAAEAPAAPPADAVPFVPGASPRVASASLRPAPVVTIRFIAGAQWDLFTPESAEAFTGSPYGITPQSDRMGYRFDGTALQRRRSFEMISEGVAFGTIQVPPDGQPIVLMADRQSTGGYPKIGNVAGVDLAVLAQLAPRQSVRFERIDLKTAQALWLAREEVMAALRERLSAGTAPPVPGDRR